MDGGIVEPPKRKKSQKRQRTERIAANFTKDEFNKVAAKITASGYSRGAYVRAALLGDAGPRAQRALPVDAQLLRQVLAQLGKYGNNLNQIAYQENAFGARGVLEADVRACLQEWSEIRDLTLKALGRDFNPAA